MKKSSHLNLQIKHVTGNAATCSTRLQAALLWLQSHVFPLWTKPHSCSTKLATYQKEQFGTSFGVRGPTYVDGEALGVLQVAEYLIRRESDAFVHRLAAGAPVKSDAFRHSRCCWTQCASGRRHVTPFVQSGHRPTLRVSVWAQDEGALNNGKKCIVSRREKKEIWEFCYLANAAEQNIRHTCCVINICSGKSRWKDGKHAKKSCTLREMGGYSI